MNFSRVQDLIAKSLPSWFETPNSSPEEPRSPEVLFEVPAEMAMDSSFRHFQGHADFSVAADSLELTPYKPLGAPEMYWLKGQINNFRQEYEKVLNVVEKKAIFSEATKIFQIKGKEKGSVDLNKLVQVCKEPQLALEICHEVYVILHRLIEVNEPKKSTIAIAQKMYKAASEFFIQHAAFHDLSSNSFDQYCRYIMPKKSQEEERRLNPASFLWFSASNPHPERQALFYFLLKHLRKRILLLTEKDKVIAGSQRLAAQYLQKVTEEQVTRACSYLGLSWLHGTDLLALRLACEQSKGVLYSIKEMHQRKIDSLTGEMRSFMTSHDLRSVCLSGVNLQNVLEASTHAREKAPLNLEKEHKLCQEFCRTSDPLFMGMAPLQSKGGEMVEPFHRNRDLIHPEDLNRKVEAMYRLAKWLGPEEFAKTYRNGIQEKIQNLNKYLHALFKVHPETFFSTESDDSPTNSRYLFLLLNAMDRIQNLLDVPPKMMAEKIKGWAKQSIPVVLGTDQLYGIPFPVTLSFESSEELMPHSISLSHHVSVIFTPREHIDTVKQFLSEQSLKIQVEAMEVVTLAAQIDRLQAAYFYDIYNIEHQKDWRERMQIRQSLMSYPPSSCSLM